MNTASWLVDIGYVTKASAGKFKLDYIKAKRFLEKAFGPTQMFVFNGYDPVYGVPEGLKAFYDSMRAQGVEVRLHPMDPGPPGANRQRRVDVDLGVHVVWQASLPGVETIVLSTGDQDLIPALDMVRHVLKKRAILFTYDAVVHHELAESADEWWRFEEHEGKLARL